MIVWIVGMALGASVIFATIAMITKIFAGEGRGKNENAEETKLIQEMHQSLNRLEDRVESLETLIVDREMKVKGADNEL